LGEELFIMKRMGKWKVPPDVNHDGAIQAYNKMHVGFKVQVEWGIGGFKQKWKAIRSLEIKTLTISHNMKLLIQV